MKVLLLIAHHDDEIIWFHDTLTSLLNNGASVGVVTIFCTDRLDEFNKSMQYYGINDYWIMGRSERGLGDIDKLKRDLVSLVNKENIDLILTHSPHGNSSFHRSHRNVFYLATKISHEVNARLAYTLLSDRRLQIMNIRNFFSIIINDTWRGLPSRGWLRSALAFSRLLVTVRKNMDVQLIEKSNVDRIKLAKEYYSKEKLDSYDALSDKYEYLVVLRFK